LELKEYHMKRLTLFATAMLAVSTLACQAMAVDIVNRKSGKPAQGDITAIAQQSVSVKSGIGEMIEVPANDIISVRWGAEPAELNLARSAEDGGNLERALEQLKMSSGNAGTNAAVKTEIEFLTARVNARVALEQDASSLQPRPHNWMASSKHTLTIFDTSMLCSCSGPSNWLLRISLELRHLSASSHEPPGRITRWLLRIRRPNWRFRKVI
jgi:hypothetical protein